MSTMSEVIHGEWLRHVPMIISQPLHVPMVMSQTLQASTFTSVYNCTSLLADVYTGHICFW